MKRHYCDGIRIRAWDWGLTKLSHLAQRLLALCPRTCGHKSLWTFPHLKRGTKMAPSQRVVKECGAIGNCPVSTWYLVRTHAQSLSCVWLFATHEPSPASLLCLWHFPGKNTAEGRHFLLQGIFLTQGWNCVSCISCIGWRILYHCVIWEDHLVLSRHSDIRRLLCTDDDLLAAKSMVSEFIFSLMLGQLHPLYICWTNVLSWEACSVYSSKAMWMAVSTWRHRMNACMLSYFSRVWLFLRL